MTGYKRAILNDKVRIELFPSSCYKKNHMLRRAFLSGCAALKKEERRINHLWKSKKPA